MYWNGRFQIDVLFWHTATTAIHQHAFSGAFVVLEGSSLHAKYAFELQRRINSRFLLGEISLGDCELLKSGDIREISRTNSLIHSLFHLDTPSVTIVVKTCIDPEAGPEYVYNLPSVAVDPTRWNPILTKRLQSLTLLFGIGSLELERLAASMLSTSDLQTCYEILRKLRLLGVADDTYGRLCESAREKHSCAEVDLLLPAIEEELRRLLIANSRKVVTDTSHRFFMALLMNLRDRESIHRLIRQRYPDTDPVASVENWCIDIADKIAIGIDFDGLAGQLFRYCLIGHSQDEIVGMLTQIYGSEAVEKELGNINEACGRIRRNRYLKPLFARTS
jgi:hypothetical protein